MSSTQRRKPHAAWQWNPPARDPAAQEDFRGHEDVPSATECTGLMSQVPESESEAHSLSSLCSIHTVKPQGNAGKCNPRNNPEEIAFHREQ